MINRGYGFTYRGRHSSEFGLFVRTGGAVLLPDRSQTRFLIPGRPGRLVLDGEAENKTLSLTLTLTGEIKERRRAARQIAGWLSGTGSLVMDYEPDLRYEVVSAVSGASADIGRGFDSFSVNFECEPYQYGQKRTYGGAAFTAENNGTAPADTIISVSGTGTVMGAAAGRQFILSAMSGTVILDSRRMAVYSPDGQAMTHIHSGGFIKIPPGGAAVTFSGASSANTEYWEMWK